MMEGNQLDYKRIVINLEKVIYHKMVYLFLRDRKYQHTVKQFSLQKGNVLMEFHQKEDAAKFIEEVHLKDQILVRKLNVFYGFFNEKGIITKKYRFQVNGVNSNNLRSMYQICKQYGPSKFNLNYQGISQLAQHCGIEFVQFDLSNDFEDLKKAFKKEGLRIRAQQNFGQFDQFRCSIQLHNFMKMHIFQNLDEDRIHHQLRKFIYNATNTKIIQIDLPKRNQCIARFHCKTPAQTLQSFQRLRKHLLFNPQHMYCRIYYFKYEANTYYTMFTRSLLNVNKLPTKQFQNQLLVAFRKINPGIVYILTQKMYEGDNSPYTGKFYMKDQDSGKDLTANYNNGRKYIYQFYKPNTVGQMDIFQSQLQRKKRNCYQDNIRRMEKQLHQQPKPQNSIRNIPNPVHLPLNPPHLTQYPGVMPLRLPPCREEVVNQRKKKAEKENNEVNEKVQYKEKIEDRSGKKKKYKPKIKEEQEKEEEVKKVVKQVQSKLKLSQDDFPAL